jgi:hypothetical protein
MQAISSCHWLAARTKNLHLALVGISLQGDFLIAIIGPYLADFCMALLLRLFFTTAAVGPGCAI